MRIEIGLRNGLKEFYVTPSMTVVTLRRIEELVKN